MIFDITAKNAKLNQLRTYILLFCLTAALPLFAQQKTKIEILNADKFTGVVMNGQEVRKLIGNVKLKHDNALMYCDSAYLYQATNSLEAFRNVHINQNDSVHLYGDKLEYDGNRKYAIVTDNVRMLDKDMTLRTSRLDYDMNSKMAFYTTGGTIIDAENTLTSTRGYYYSSQKDLFFRDSVRLVNPKYTMDCDTLQYNISNRRAYFHGPTYIRSEQDLIYCETGWYHTMDNIAEFGKNAYLASANQLLYGDKLYYERDRGYGKAIGNVKVHDTTEHLVIYGQFAEHFEQLNETFITKEVLVSKGFKEDSIYMTADTLRSIYDSTGEHRIMRAFHQAKVFGKDFQAISDSMIYSTVDSTIDMLVRPAMWVGKYQITSDKMKIFTRNNDLERAEFYNNGFIINPEDSSRFSQIKGRDMTAYFKDNELSVIDVIGNGESIYYVKDEDSAYVGMNYITSSNIRITMADQELSTVHFINSPEGKMTPMKQIAPQDSKLKGFLWRESERPKSIEALLNGREMPAPPPSLNSASTRE